MVTLKTLQCFAHVSTHLKMPWKGFGRQTVNPAGLWMGLAVLNSLCWVDCFYFIQYFLLKYQFIIDGSDVSDAYPLALDLTCEQTVQIDLKILGLWKYGQTDEFLVTVLRSIKWQLRTEGSDLVVFHRFRRCNLAFSFLYYCVLFRISLCNEWVLLLSFLK